jgi:glutamine---fructose-6-phosphate transaminase (isomerizing)
MTAIQDRYLEEILGQPGALERAGVAIGAQEPTLRGLAELPRREPVVLTGMGSSYDACLAAAAALGAAGELATTIDTAELLHTRRRSLRRAGLVILVSQSGRSAEALRLAETLAQDRGEPGPVLLTITNGADTPLAGLGELALDTRAGQEVCPSTMTFAGSLVVLAAVIEVLLGASGDEAIGTATRMAREAASAASLVLRDPGATGLRVERWLGGRSTIIALGRGTGLAAAEMTALSLMEAAGVPAASMPTAEFRHGPLEIVGPDLAVVLFALEPATVDLDRDFAAELDAAQAAVLFVGPPDLRAGSDRFEHVAVPATSAILAPAVAIGPLQLLARQLAHARGRRPETFVFASKVTTRE